MQTATRHAASPLGVAAQSTPRGMWRDWRIARVRLTVGVLCSLALAACSGGETAAPATSATAVIGPAGGTLTGPDGVEVIVPPGALSQATTIVIARSSSGAPDPLDAYPVSGSVYELTPHDVAFNVPVTVRAPVGSAPDPQLFMASPGQPWVGTPATYANGIAEWQRSSFSWLYVGSCSVPTGMEGDPNWCMHGLSVAHIRATPVEAMTQTEFPRDPANGAFGAYRVDQAATLELSQFVKVPGNCGNVTVRFLRRSWADPLFWWSPAVLGRTQVLATQHPVMTASGPGYLIGTASLTVPFSHLDAGHNQFVMTASYDCPGIVRTPIGGGRFSYAWDPSNPRHFDMWGDGIMVEGNVPTPAVLYAVGGFVSGLVGSGLVLQDNGGDDLPVVADGTFTFVTPVGAGAPYGVTVLTQPTSPAQTCTVQNGAGTASANVTSVNVTCVTTPTTKSWQGADLLETIDEGDAFEAQVAFDGGGNGMAVWSQFETSSRQFKIWARRYVPATGWGTAQRIQTDSTLEGRGPRVAFQANGDAKVVWLQYDAAVPNLWITSFTASTGAWGGATRVNIPGESTSVAFPQVAVDGGGNALVSWAERDGSPVYHIKARRLDAGGWGAVQAIDSAPGLAIRSRIAMDAAGDAMVVWLQESGAGDDVWARRFVVGTGWGPATLIETNDRVAANLDVVSDAAGNAMAVWVQADETNPVTNSSAVYSNRFSAGGWGTAALVKAGAPFAWESTIAMNASGDAVVVWEEDDGSDGASVWARSYAAGVGGTPVRIDDQTTVLAVSPWVGIDSGGNAVAVWKQAGRILSNRATAGAGWGVPTDIDGSTGLGAANLPQVAVDGAGNAIALWQREGSSAIRGPNLWFNLLK